MKSVFSLAISISTFNSGFYKLSKCFIKNSLKFVYKEKFSLKGMARAECPADMAAPSCRYCAIAQPALGAVPMLKSGLRSGGTGGGFAGQVSDVT